MENIILTNAEIDRIKKLFVEGFSRRIEDLTKDIDEIEKFKDYNILIEEIYLFAENLMFCIKTYKFSELEKLTELLIKIYNPLKLKNIMVNNEIVDVSKDILKKYRLWIDGRGSGHVFRKGEDSEFVKRIDEILEFARAAKIKSSRETEKEKIVPITSTDLENLKNCIYDIYTNFSYMSDIIRSNIPERFLKYEWYKNFTDIEKSFENNLTLIQKEYFGFRRLDIKNMIEELEFEIRNFAMSERKNVRINFSPTGFKLDVFQIETVSDILRELLKNIVEHSIQITDNKNNDGNIRLQTMTAVYDISVKFIEDSKNVYIEIEDNGGGFEVDEIVREARKRNLINDSDSHNLGELFFNILLNLKKSRKKDGGGQGLRKVKNYLEKINGSIRFKLRNLRGTQMTIEFPHFKKIM